ncbi:MAG TPA: ATP-binding cassette domain-containing protein [Solirubrobacteraceae bacterium]|nr:ATP-binding cassette domain-containing protein [Solirubrobacteraceae bacterium]
MSEVLRLDSVSMGFDRGRDRVCVLQDVSLSVGEGQIAAVIGGPSQGKTTLIRLAAGLLSPDEGRVHVGGVALAELRDRQRQHMLARDIGLALRTGPAMRASVREYVEMKAAAPKNGWRRLHRGRERQRMTTAVLDELGIADCADMRWEHVSDWQRCLADLAQAMVVSPRLLLIDDLSSPFGLRQKQNLMAFLEDFAREHSCAVLMAVSDEASALRSAQVWRLHRHQLKLRANHTGDVEAEGDVIPMRRAEASGGPGR